MIDYINLIWFIPIVVGITFALFHWKDWWPETFESTCDSKFKLVEKDGLTYVVPRGEHEQRS